MPFPGTSRTCSTANGPAGASAATAREAGCREDLASAEAASISSSGTVKDATFASPEVKVPVLSSATRSISASRSRAAPSFSVMPSAKSRRAATAWTIGTARPSAQGQVMMRTAIAIVSGRCRFSVAAIHPAPVARARRCTRVQIVKGWVDAGGARQEKVYDVAWSDERVPDADGKLPPVGNTVDVATATWTNTIGSSELITAWTDPEFDPALRAFYYARVLEIPTPRWTAYDAVRFGTKMPADVPMFGQERAYTSPIWYTPG